MNNKRRRPKSGSSQKYIRVKEENKLGIFMIDVSIRMDIDQWVEIGEFHLVLEFSVDRIGQDMNRISEEVILEVM